MKATKIVVILVIIAVLGGGIYLIQNKKEKKALAVHHNKRFKQIIEDAKKSRLAGLSDMRLALKRYHQKTGQYPKDLMELCPEFIPDKSFITELNWQYTPAKGTYSIKRSTKGSDVYVSFGPDSKVKTEKETASKPVRAIASVDRSKIQTQKKTGIKNKINTIELPKPVSIMKPASAVKKPKYEPEFTIIKKELSDHEKFLHSFSRSKLYIWKSSDGIIGFSDIQYPDEKQLLIYKENNWIEYQENIKSGKSR